MLRCAGIAVVGTSTAAVETAIHLPELGIAFDVGCCPQHLVRARHVFLSHGHVDHCGAIAQHASVRALGDLPPADYYTPAAIRADIEQVFATYSALGQFPLPRRVLTARPDDEIVVRRDLRVRPFAVDHRVPSQGYLVTEVSERLAPRFANLTGPEIARLREAGGSVTETFEAPLVAFSGDTRIEAIERNEAARRARVLILEATYLTPDQPVAKARERGHIHLDEIIERAAMFENEAIVLTHFSARYRAEEIHDILHQRLPPELGDRVFALL
jgi:ribonuclease Z